MLSDDPPTNSELDRRFNRLENSIDTWAARIDQHIAKMVTVDVFAMFREAMEQRVAAAEERQNTLGSKHDRDIADVRNDLERSEQQRDEQRDADRRNTNKIVATVAIGILSVVVALAGVFLPMLLGS